MSKNEWRQFALLGLAFVGLVSSSLAATALIVANFRQEHASQRDDAASANQPEAQRKVLLNCPAFPSALRDQCVDKEVEAAQAEKREQYDLRAQQEMAQYALGVLAISVLGFVVSSAGLVALFYTFNEQRKLSRSQARAYLELIGARVTRLPGWRASYLRIGIRNTGQTPASNIRIVGICTADPGAVEGKELGQVHTQPIEEWLHREMPSLTQDVLEWSFGADLDFLKTNHQPRYGTDTCRMPILIFKGTLFYDDAFGQLRELPFVLNTSFLDEEDRSELAGAGRDQY